MPLVLVIAVVALAAMYWRHRTSGLTRNCRWRRVRPGEWECAYCGAGLSLEPGRTPNICARAARRRQPGQGGRGQQETGLGAGAGDRPDSGRKRAGKTAR